MKSFYVLYQLEGKRNSMYTCRLATNLQGLQKTFPLKPKLPLGKIGEDGLDPTLLSLSAK
jgi:hypothetical protein